MTFRGIQVCVIQEIFGQIAGNRLLIQRAISNYIIREYGNVRERAPLQD